ncbi:MAG TPA: hypothetical protein VGF13_12085 [Verrucomicrobiae bacterium]
MKSPRIIVLAACVSALAGCRREEIRVYTAPKDPPPRQEAAHGPNDGHDHGDEVAARPRPQLSWKLPEGWRESPPGRMSVATFSIASGAQEAQVTVTPLPMLGGRDAVVVNMWREQVGLKPLEPDEVTKQLQDVVVGPDNGKLFEVAGKNGEAPMRIVTAMVHRPDASWFYKLSGDAALVEAQKPAFIEFLKSVRLKESAAAEAEPAGETGKPKWDVPGGWKQTAPGQMQFARFVVPQQNGVGGEVFVSVFPSDTGGTLANINRWQRQLKLPETDEKSLASLTAPLDAVMPNAVLVDLTNGTQRLLGAIVPRGGQWWFYKLLGDSAAVGAERENFIRFAKSTP